MVILDHPEYGYTVLRPGTSTPHFATSRGEVFVSKCRVKALFSTSTRAVLRPVFLGLSTALRFDMFCDSWLSTALRFDMFCDLWLSTALRFDMFCDSGLSTALRFDTFL